LYRIEALLAAAALLILSATFLLSYRDWKEFRASTEATNHTEWVLNSTETLLSALKDAESGQRGYLLTGESKYLEPYNASRAVISEQLKNLIASTGGEGRQAERAALLVPLISEKMAELQLTIDVMQKQGAAAAIEIVHSDRGKQAMDQIRAICGEIISDEYKALVDRSAQSEAHGQRSRLVTTLGSAILFVMLVIAGVGISAAAARRERLIEQIRVAGNEAAEARDLLRTTLASIGDAVITTDDRGRVTFLNPVAQTLTRYSDREALGKPIEEVFRIVNESTRATVESPVTRVLRESAVVGLANHTVLIARDGVELPIDDSGAPIRDQSGAMAGVVLVFRDITERKRAEALARRLAAIVESSDDAIVAQRLDGVITNWNTGAEKMFGYTAREMVGGDFSTLIPEGSGENPLEAVERIGRGEPVVHYEAGRRRKDGGRVDVAVTASPIRNETGAVIGVSRICRDITERNRTLENLQESQRSLQLSAEAARIGIWHNDLIANRVTWSPQMQSLFGLEPQAFRGTREHAVELIHPEDRARVAEIVAAAIASKSDFDIEFRVIGPSREIRWMFGRGRPLSDSTGQVTRVAGVTIDITDRKRLEEKMRQSQKLESLGVLAGGLAHDFNNLLVGILGNASLLMEEISPESPLRPVIENLLQASDRAAHLTRQMLAYSGKGRFTIERLNLDLQVQQILALIEASIPKGVRIELNFDRDLPHIEADAGQIQQLVMNLVINGAEAIGPGGGVVAISTSVQEVDQRVAKDNLAGDTIANGMYVVLEVRDTGIGMDAATQAKIFDPFFTTKFTGRGLGLAAVQGIVRGHKGALTISSEPGKGSAFRVYLPTARPQEFASAEALPLLTDFQGEGTILVVDDEELVRHTLQAALERYGYAVLTAGSGPDAIRMLGEAPDRISLVLLDMTMPVMSGADTLKGLLAVRADIPVIATSGYDEMEALRRFGQRISGFIQKPYPPRRLAEKIRETLEKRASGPPA